MRLAEVGRESPPRNFLTNKTPQPPKKNRLNKGAGVIESTCYECGKRFQRVDGEPRFCSESCEDLWREEERKFLQRQEWENRALVNPPPDPKYERMKDKLQEWRENQVPMFLQELETELYWKPFYKAHPPEQIYSFPFGWKRAV